MSVSERVRVPSLKISALLFVLPLFVAGCSLSLPSSEGFNRTVYAGVTANASRLDPDTSESSVFSIEDNQSGGFGVLLGLDLANRWSAEAQFIDLGSAELTPAASVDYQSLGASVLYYAIADEDSLAYREGFAAFLRGGVNLMMHDSDIALDDEDNAQITAGLGLDYMLSNRIAFRGELAFHDVDAQAAQIGVLYRFGSTGPKGQGPQIAPPRPPSRPTIARRPLPEAAPDVDVKPAPQASPRPQIRQPEVVQPEIVAIPPVQTPSAGTLLTDGVLSGVDFGQGSARLDVGAQNVLNSLAQELQQQPSTVIEVQAHTSGAQGSRPAMNLARARVAVVGRYLISRGVSASQVKARAFGANRPLPGGSAALNDRIELQVLQP